jgi:hypothetical protein
MKAEGSISFTPAGRTTDFRGVNANASFCMHSSCDSAANVRRPRDLQPEKAFSPITLSDAGRVPICSPVQLRKALVPIDSSPSSKLTTLSDSTLSNALSPMSRTVEGITISDGESKQTIIVPRRIKRDPHIVQSGAVTEVRLESRNAEKVRFVVESGRSSVFRRGQPWKME